VLGAVRFVRNHERPSKEIILVGFKDCGAIVAAARAMAGDTLARAVIDTAGFRFATVPAIDHPDFLPGGAKYGDIPGLLAFGTGQMLLAGEKGKDLEFVQAHQRATPVKVGAEDPDKFRRAAIDWLTAE
jgi:hypothetical protein